MNPIKVGYITASQFSGTTLLSLLLNNHPEIASIGHTMGCPFENPEEFKCSCGSTLEKCPLFEHIHRQLDSEGIRFHYNDFNTAFRLAKSSRINPYLVESLPRVQSNVLDNLRDTLCHNLPRIRDRKASQEQSNIHLMSSVLDYFDANIYIDNSHSPYRMKMLNAVTGLKLTAIHLIRDPRAVTNSIMKNSGWPIGRAIHSWIKRQTEITRILPLIDTSISIFYEQLCGNPDEELDKVQELLGVKKIIYKECLNTKKEHHVLGNNMRLSFERIKLNEEWKISLSGDEIHYLNDVLRQQTTKRPHSRLTEIIDYYLNQE